MPATTKRKPKLGDLSWEVEWCVEIPKDKNGDHDMDRADFRAEFVESKEAADALAREVYPQTVGVLGHVEITPMRFTEPCGDSYTYDGPED